MSQWVTEGSLGAILYNSRIVTDEDIRKAVTEQERLSCRFGEALVHLGIVTAEDINWALSHHLNIPYIRLNREVMGADAATLLPERIARRYHAVPVIRTGDELRVALVDPLDKEALKEIAAVSAGALTICIADEKEVREMLDYLYGPEPQGTFGILSSAASPQETAAMVADTSGGRFLKWLLFLLTRKGYVSVTVAPLAEGGVVTGCQGIITEELGRLTLGGCARITARLRARAVLRKSSPATESGSMEYVNDGETLTIQVELLKGSAGKVITLKQAKSPRDVPFPPELFPLVHEMTERPGLVVVSLPMKETLNMMELLVNRHSFGQERLLLLGEGNETIRKQAPCIPLENISPEEHAAIITAVLEHAPDLLLLEGMDDSRSLHAAAQAALRGVRVVAGTGVGCAETYALLFSAWRQDHLIPSALRGIVMGEIFFTLCHACRKPLPMEPREGARLRLPPAATGYHHATGCAACGFTGRGEARLLAEVIVCDRLLVTLLESCGTGGEFAQRVAQREGETVRAQAIRLLLGGEISPETYLRVVTA